MTEVPSYGGSHPVIGATVATGNSVEYYCSEGYKLNGVTYAKCGPSGYFLSELPTCIKPQCTVPNVPANGKSNPAPGGIVSVGAVVSYHCLDGYQIVGHHKATCEGNGQFSPKTTPSCQATYYSKHLATK